MYYLSFNQKIKGTIPAGNSFLLYSLFKSKPMKPSIMCLIGILVFSGFSMLSGQESAVFTILHTNDMHSRLQGDAPELSYSPGIPHNDETMGGFSRLASLIAREKAKAEGPVLVLDAGDFLMGTFFHALETETGFQPELMKQMGYDVVSIGNHEFDFGPEALAWIFKSASARGELPGLVLSNMRFDKKAEEDDLLEEVFEAGLIRRYQIMEKGGVRIGIFGLMGKDAEEVAPYAKPITFDKAIPAARKVVKELKSEGCDIVICLSHSGLEKDKQGGWTGEDAKLAEKVKDIDIIVSGHTHSKLEKPLLIGNTVIVQTGSYGKYLGKLLVEKKGQDISLASYELIPVDDAIPGNSVIQQQIDRQKDMVEDRLLSPLGIAYDDAVVEVGYGLTCDEYGDLEASNLGPLIADAIHAHVNTHVDQGADVSMIAAGMIRDGLTPGKQSVSDIFRIVSLGSGEDQVPGYPLARVYVTGKELKSIMEILMIAWKSSPSNYCYFSGIIIHFDESKGFLNKVSKLEIKKPDGSIQHVSFDRKDETLYGIVANAYMLEFVGMLKKMSFGLINVKPKFADGRRVEDMKYTVLDFDSQTKGIQEGKEWIALLEFLTQMQDVNANGLPDISPWYREARSAIVRIK